jgi:hypothetical protein
MVIVTSEYCSFVDCAQRFSSTGYPPLCAGDWHYPETLNLPYEWLKGTMVRVTDVRSATLSIVPALPTLAPGSRWHSQCTHIDRIRTSPQPPQETPIRNDISYCPSPFDNHTVCSSYSTPHSNQTVTPGHTVTHTACLRQCHPTRHTHDHHTDILSYFRIVIIWMR